MCVNIGQFDWWVEKACHDEGRRQKRYDHHNILYPEMFADEIPNCAKIQARIRNAAGKTKA